jgi:tetratricopeptide (TPR) repeat protein
MQGKLPGFGNMFNMLWYLIIALALLLLIPRIATYSIVNAAERDLTRSLIAARGDHKSRTQRLLQPLDEFVPGQSAAPALRSLAYAALETGDYAIAARAWNIQNSPPEDLPLEVVERYLQEEGIPSQVFRDMTARGYQQNAEADLRAGKVARARSSLEGILQLRPADLYAHFQLRQLALKDGQAAIAQQHADALQNYAIEAIAPTVDILIPSVEHILPTLLDEHIWNEAEAQRIVAFIVWQYSGVDETVSLLGTLAQRYPHDASWPFYLGELYHRRQDWQHAEQGYLRALEINAEYVPAYLRLGMLAEQQSEQVSTQQPAWRERAITWYRQYLQRVPNDPVGQQRLAAVSALAGTTQDAQLSTGLELLKDDRHLVSTLLNVVPDTIVLGDTLIGGDTFRPASVPHAVEDWVWNMIAGLPDADSALFTGGLDALEGADYSAVRVDGLWLRNGTGTARARAGFRHSELVMPPDAVWLVAFSYSTSAEEGEQGAAIWLTPTRNSGFTGEIFLPATSATWRREAMVIHNRTGQPVRLIPQLRNWSMQSVWFDHVVVRPIQLAEDVTQHIPSRLTTWQIP